MFDDFQGYRLPTEAEIDDALRLALIVIDANLLLNLYRYTESTRDDLLGVMGRLGDRLWVPHQVLREFWRNRLGVLTGRGSGTEQALAALAKQQRATADILNQWAKMVAIEATDRDTLHAKVERTYAEVEDTIKAHAPSVPSVAYATSNEPVLRELEKLLDGKVGPAPSPKEWEEAIREGQQRVARRIPPGYLDSEKASSDLPEGAAGDYLVWHQTIQEASRRDLDVVLVTGDEKDDWWWRHRSEFLGPRIELVAELRASCGHRLFMMRPIDLLKRAAAVQVEISSASVDDVERVSRETQARPTWSPDGVSALLERLETEGWEHAEVIRAAAARGGSISREAIYEIAGYEDDRMLRGFTRPSARITADLQRLGIVADGVEPALTPVYSGVKASAFRIPAEMVSIIMADEGVASPAEVEGAPEAASYE